MKRTSPPRRTVLVAALVLLAAAAGIGIAMLGSGGRLSYTEHSPNPSTIPSIPGRPIVLTPAASRPAPPDFAFADAAGQPLRSTGLGGRVTLINLWATWCPPCVAEMPDLDALQGKMGGNDFRVVAVSLDRGGKAVVERWFQRAGIAHLAIHNANPADFPDALLPTSLLLDARGRLAWAGTGIYAWTGAEATDAIAALVAEGKSRP